MVLLLILWSFRKVGECSNHMDTEEKIISIKRAIWIFKLPDTLQTIVDVYRILFGIHSLKILSSNCFFWHSE